MVAHVIIKDNYYTLPFRDKQITRDSGLSAVLDGWNPASVSGLDELIKGCVDKRWDASLRFAAVVVTSRRPSRVPIRLRRDPFTPRLTRSQFWVRFK